jgi:hypothetical protein
VTVGESLVKSRLVLHRTVMQTVIRCRHYPEHLVGASPCFVVIFTWILDTLVFLRQCSLVGTEQLYDTLWSVTRFSSIVVAARKSSMDLKK